MAINKDKIYYPETIDSYDVDGIAESGSDASSFGSKAVVVQDKVINPNFPTSLTAREVISRTLDTQRKKILGEFTFNAQGAFKVGEYEAGVSGEVAFSSDGITAINSSNATTFSINGDTGDAVFKGTVQAGSIISGSITLGGSADGDGVLLIKDAAGTTIVTGNKDGITIEDGVLIVKNDSDVTVIDAKGLVSTATFSSSSINGSGTQAVDGATYVDITDVTRTFSLGRTQNVLVFGYISGFSSQTSTADAALGRVLVDSTPLSAFMPAPGRVFADGTGYPTTAFIQEVVQLAAGSHTVKLQARSAAATTGAVSVSRANCSVGYVVLGN